MKTRFFSRAAMMLLLMVLTTASAWAQQAAVNYIDMDGNTQTVSDYTVVTSSAMTALEDGNIYWSGGTYVVKAEADVTLSGCIRCDDGVINLILCDGATLTVNGSENWAFDGSTLNIYAQSTGTNMGVLTANGCASCIQLNVAGGRVTLSDNTYGLYLKDVTGCGLTVNGGDVTIQSDNGHDGTLYCSNDNAFVTLNGGKLTVTNNTTVMKRAIDGYGNNTINLNGGTAEINGWILDFKNINLNGGNVTVNGEINNEDWGYTVTYDFTRATDSYYIKAFSNVLKSGKTRTVQVKEGVTFLCGGNSYSGTLSNEQIEAISDKTMTPDISADFSKDSDTEYTIHTAKGWGYFCDMLQDNDTWNRFSGKTVKLADDISVTRMAGSDYHDFCGTFDGNQKTLTVSYGTSGSPIDENNVAPFRNLQSYCIIKDLHVAGDIYTSGQFAGGLAGTMFGTVKIENCLVSTVIHSYTSGDGTHGGIVGHAGNNSSTNLTIEGCVFDGKLLTCGSTNTTNSSGFVGYKHNSGTVSISNSLYAPAALGTGETEITSGSATFMRNAAEGSITNCYYTRTLGTEQGNSPDGTCGSNVYYAYDSSTKTLNIFGTGAMNNYSLGKYTPWNSYRENITTVVIGNGVTSIGNSAFDGCNGLTSITIPSSVTSIGQSAFFNCTSLTSIEIPASVTSIGLSAFYGCTSLASIEIPSSVTSIGSAPFGGCSGLTSISVELGNPTYHSEGNCIIETATKTLIQGCKTSIIPNTVTSIADNAFYGCTWLTSITIPASVTSIGLQAFYYCKNLASIEIPSSVTSIGNSAFHGCAGLTSIEIPSSVTSIGEHAFNSCTKLASVTIYAPSLTTYGTYAFDTGASGRKIYVFSDCVETYKGKASTLGVSQNAILPITLTANEGATGQYWTTYYNELANAKVPEGAQAFKVTLTGTTLALTPISDGIISRGEAVVIKSTSDSVLPESSASASTDTNDNHLQGTMKTITNPGNAYVLNKKGENGVGFYKLSTSGTIGAHKAYLVGPASAPEFFLFSDATGISEIEKMRNAENETYYTLDGRKLSGKPTKGLYIVNGKKVVIK